MTWEDVISWLEYLSDDARSEADSLVPTNIEIACGMAIDALKAQEPRVMTLEEMDALGDNAIVWLECLYFIDGKNTTELKPAIYQADNSSPEEDGYYCVVSSWGRSGFYHKDSYMGDWRCWTSRPDEKVRAETPWE